MKPYFVFLLATLIAAPLAAQIYKHVDENGKVSYSDKPAEDQKNEQVELKPINTTPGMDLEQLAKEKQNFVSHFNADYQLFLSSPSDGAHMMAHQRDLQIEAGFTVTIRSNSPDQAKIDQEKQAAMAAAKIEIYFNGNKLASDNGKATIKEITRGEHKITARLVNGGGKELAPAASATVYVHRPLRR
ncbi:DUF4124 domain-containing protein [Pseudoteredinibacter isoporae]|uniref:DUF4124 domain-containing protein n=1 Tax=Pseudoteredinibacter isoporae TaxID=570281 RepID=A0A7X0MVH8_9GAMM|nr:DUF4124 domain-containing protein [Pseudoteredinibacter isoporae]MBB6519859.1 hypothetical protein [Pseudoteredinibacter isoporae]NHO85437.1 DUF4124 domain-containing protein [Pseudoteredinibacter isoporae]NIB26111.1 DUF4124 domain-containing protein [Pseudoteredinibacter isoporae]